MRAYTMVDHFFLNKPGKSRRVHSLAHGCYSVAHNDMLHAERKKKPLKIRKKLALSLRKRSVGALGIRYNGSLLQVKRDGEGLHDSGFNRHRPTPPGPS